MTNILRHSKAKRCDITIRQTQDDAWIEIVNDDLAVGPPRDPGSGRNGLRNLCVRAEEIGGSLTVDQQPDQFRLCARVPLRLERHGASRSQPAGLPGDPDGVDAVARGELVDDRGQVVADGAD